MVRHNRSNGFYPNLISWIIVIPDEPLTTEEAMPLCNPSHFIT